MILGENAFKDSFYCSYYSLLELESIKTSVRKDEETKYKARKITRFLSEKSNFQVITPRIEEINSVLSEFGLSDSADNIICACAYILSKNSNQEIIFMSNDISCGNIAHNVFGLQTSPIRISSEEYYGYKTIYPTEEELANLYSNLEENIYSLKENEYLIIKDNEEKVIDLLKWQDNSYKHITNKSIDSRWMGKVKPRNTEQKLAMDLLQNESIPIKVLTGRYGVGKDYLMISQAINGIEKGHFDKLVWIRNTTEVKNSKALGFLPGKSYCPAIQ